ncbi:hypothetical protein [Microbacterium hominis]|uniref:hypothetical protein n=1 Tax=Microbacterium hominis TaxID=162426 RepID=UPI000AE1E875|nr:hypothetical protein [Microbacterium hominis]
MASPFDQSRYQVRLEWGADGLDRVAASDVVVVVDVLRFSSTVARRVATGDAVALDDAAHAASVNGAAIAARAGATGAVVLPLRRRRAGRGAPRGAAPPRRAHEHPRARRR